MLHDRANASRSETVSALIRRRRRRSFSRVAVLSGNANRGRGGELFVFGGAVLQRGRGVDHLERRTGRIALGDGPVGQRRMRVVAKLLATVCDLLFGVIAVREQVLVVGSA